MPFGSTYRNQKKNKKRKRKNTLQDRISGWIRKKRSFSGAIRRRWNRLGLPDEWSGVCNLVFALGIGAKHEPGRLIAGRGIFDRGRCFLQKSSASNLAIVPYCNMSALLTKANVVCRHRDSTLHLLCCRGAVSGDWAHSQNCDRNKRSATTHFPYCNMAVNRGLLCFWGYLGFSLEKAAA